MSESKDLVVVQQPTVEEPPPPPPPRMAPRPPEPDLGERIMLFVELRPWTTALAIFAALTLVHVLILNIAGVAEGFYIGDRFLLTSGASSVEVVMLAFIAYSIVAPTLVGHACIRAYDALRPAVMLDDRGYGETRAGIVDGFHWRRFWIALGCAVILTPGFGDVLRKDLQGEGTAYAWQAIWLYLRIAMTFALLGSTITYVIALHRRFRAVTGEHLRIDLFDFAPLRPVPRYAKLVAFYLMVLMALLGPAISNPDEPTISAVLFGIGIGLVAAAVVAAMLGTSNSIAAAKKLAMNELSTYSRELWRRAYAGQRIVEAMAIPALGAMITTRAEIKRLTEWPGGLNVAARFALCALIPLVTWFGPSLMANLAALLAP